MIVLEARININNTADIGTIDSVHETNARVQSNISSGEPIKDGSGNVTAIDLASVLNNIKPSINPYRLNYSVLDSGAKFWDEKSLYIGGELSAREQSADGSYAFGTPYRFEIETASGIAFFGIMFDSLNRNYPTEIVVDGVPYVNNSGIFYAFNLNKAVKKHTIEITKFSTPYAPLQIQGVFSNIEIVVDNRNSISFEIDIDDRENNAKPSFGIVSNGGSLSFIDSNGIVKNLIDCYMLDKNSTVEIIIINTVYKKKKIIGRFYVTEVKYDIYTNVCDITMNDSLIKLQESQQYWLSPRGELVALAVFSYLRDITPKQYYFVYDEMIYYFESITIKYPYLESGNIWNLWDKFCQATAVHMYINTRANAIQFNKDI